MDFHHQSKNLLNPRWDPLGEVGKELANDLVMRTPSHGKLHLNLMPKAYCSVRSLA